MSRAERACNRTNPGRRLLRGRTSHAEEGNTLQVMSAGYSFSKLRTEQGSGKHGCLARSAVADTIARESRRMADVAILRTLLLLGSSALGLVHFSLGPGRSINLSSDRGDGKAAGQVIAKASEQQSIWKLATYRTAVHCP